MNHEVKFPREYREEIRKFETSDYGNAEVLNQPLNILVNNDVYIKEQLETVQQGLQNHQKTTAVHVTEAQKNAWTKKAETTAATTSANGLMTAADKAKLDGIAAGAEVNQNAFQTVRAGGVNVQADGTTAQVELVAGNNLTITGDNGTKKITITGPNAVKNPAALAVQLNGSAAVSYDGSAAKTVNITPGGIGAAAAGHTHDDRYYTEAETNNLLNGKANSSHTHTAAQVSGLPTTLPANGGTAARIFNGANTNDTAMQFNWNGQNGQPNWLWGGNDGKNMYVYNPAVFRVDYANSAGSANSVSWGNVSGKPSTFPPTSHTHDERYYTEAEIDTKLNSKANSNAPVFTNSISMWREADTVIGQDSVTLGFRNTASNRYSIAGGFINIASGDRACVMGGSSNTASANCACVMGANSSTASGACSAVVGGVSNIASGEYAAVVGGVSNTASGEYSFAVNEYNIANGWGQTVVGRRNKPDSSNNTIDTLFKVGNGYNASNLSNAFRVTYSGDAYIKTAYHTSGADYAEYFEWADKNKEMEDRVGYFVTLNGNKIKIAGAEDSILGIVSGAPSIIGNSPEDWAGRWQHDEFGRELKVKSKIPILDENGNKTGKYTELEHPVAAETYDSTKVYIERDKRPEWSPVGMLGVLAVREDGTCQVNGYCQVANGGIATAADGTEEYALVNGQITKRYRVIERITDHIVKIVFR